MHTNQYTHLSHTLMTTCLSAFSSIPNSKRAIFVTYIIFYGQKNILREKKKKQDKNVQS